MNEWKIIGHDWAVRRLSHQVDAGQLAQSHLFVGMPSVGKAALASALAIRILSQGAHDPTRAAHLVAERKHPDLTWIGSEDGSIKVEPIREMLHSLTLAPLEGPQRVAIVDDAHLATDSSKNAILKTLEEPNPSSVIILITPSIDGVLPTITSRCQILNLRPVATRTLEAALLQQNVDAPRAGLVARLARGRPGWALRAVETPQLLEDRARRLDDLRTLLSENRTQRFEFSEALSKAGDDAIQSMLDEWLWFWRDVVRANSELDPADTKSEKLHNIDRVEAITDVAKRVTLQSAIRMVRAISSTMRTIQQNASARLSLDALLLGMPLV